LTKQATMGEHHQSQIAAVVDEWDHAEKRYNDLKKKDPVVAEEKMKRTLEVFRQTLAALEQESKDEKERLRIEHADCINTQISKDKRDAMINYLAVIQKEPANADEILSAVRKFIQVCEHDRVHSLRHFEHVRRKNASKADAIRADLLQHLKGLNKVVNESMSLLNYLPEIAKKFGLNGNTAVLKPKTELPEIKHDSHIHHRINEILEKNKHLTTEDDEDDDDDDDEEAIFVTSAKRLVAARPTKEAIKEEESRYNSPHTKSLGRVVAAKGDSLLTEPDDVDMIPEDPRVEKRHGRRSPMVINIILGLCCGILVVMLVVVIVMVIQRRRVAHTRVVIADQNDDREHLIQMQKSGFENPTYKFFYY